MGGVRAVTASRALAVGGSVVLAVLTVAVLVADGPLPGEVEIILRLQRLGEPVPSLASFARATTGTEGNLVVGALPAVWLVRRHGHRGIAAVAICLASLLIVQPVSKVLVDRDRPSAEQVEVRAAHSSLSYPSGHSLSTSTVWGTAAGLALRHRRRRWAALLAVPIAATAVSSGVHGVHWASDAVAGTIAGLLAASFALRALERDATGHPAGVTVPAG